MSAFDVFAIINKCVTEEQGLSKSFEVTNKTMKITAKSRSDAERIRQIVAHQAQVYPITTVVMSVDGGETCVWVYWHGEDELHAKSVGDVARELFTVWRDKWLDLRADPEYLRIKPAPGYENILHYLLRKYAPDLRAQLLKVGNEVIILVPLSPIKFYVPDDVDSKMPEVGNGPEHRERIRKWNSQFE